MCTKIQRKQLLNFLIFEDDSRTFETETYTIIAYYYNKLLLLQTPRVFYFILFTLVWNMVVTGPVIGIVKKNCIQYSVHEYSNKPSEYAGPDF